MDDATGDILLKTGVPLPLDVEAGIHKIEFWGPDFNPTQVEIDISEKGDEILCVEPNYLEGAARSSKLGSLNVRVVETPHDIGLYRFYAEMPTSLKTRSLTHSVVISIGVSLLFALVGIAAVLMIPVVTIVKGAGTGLVLSIPCLFVASGMIPIGVGGAIAGWRFLRLPRSWR
jgi:hypothetical protein